MPTKTAITVAHGDGIGPEIENIDIGEKVYLRGNTAGIEPGAWESLRRTKVFLKAPITTPQGGGFKSLNVTTRKRLGLYANVRPCVAYYAGIAYQLSPDATQCIKLISRPGCEKIVRFAFEYAIQNNRKKVTCFTKDNIMKMTDGLFHKVFDEIGSEYPTLEKEHWIVDIGAAKMADTPNAFDVIVMPNLYGDILSDVAAQIAGSVGLAGSANVGLQCAMFEAIHGSAPRRAGQNLANPSGLLLGGVMMLVHIGQPEAGDAKRKDWTPGTSPAPAIQTAGVDLYIAPRSTDSKAFGDKLAKIAPDGLKLQMIDSRGVILNLMHAAIDAGYDVVKTESLRTYDGKPGYSLAQGQ